MLAGVTGVTGVTGKVLLGIAGKVPGLIPFPGTGNGFGLAGGKDLKFPSGLVGLLGIGGIGKLGEFVSD